MTTPLPTFRRAPPPPANPGRPGRAPIPAGQHNTAATAADGRVRLNKRMAELGLASRREADAWIEQGWVRVDGQMAVMGQQVAPNARIEVAPQARGQQAQAVTVLLHKPMGWVSGQAEDGHRPAIQLVQPAQHWPLDRSPRRFHPGQLQHLVAAGRLDVDSTGLLVLTQDGRIARQLIGEDSAIEKEYLVRVTHTGQANAAAAHSAAATYAAAPRPQAAALQAIDERDAAQEDVRAVFPPAQLALLRHGLSLDGEPLAPAQVDWQNPQQLRFVLTQGKKRQIRRMCELVGLKVLGLKRVRIGRVRLGELPVGQWRYLGPQEGF